MVLFEIIIPIVLTLIMFRAMECSMNNKTFWTGKPEKR
jgi:hypothetical protein